MKHHAQILLSPRITEKGAYLAESGAYAYNGGVDANKKEIAEAIHTVFKIWPRKVTVMSVRSKKVQTRGARKVGYTAAGKKAYVFLKPGEKIDLV